MRRALLIAVALLVSAPAAAKDYVGAAACGVCHQAEYEQWKSTGHAVALSRLSKRQQRDAGCRSCHTMDPRDANAELAGVQCESCHGGGRFYAPRHVMKDAKLARLLGLQTITEKTCASCHRADGPGVHPFDFATKLAHVAHKPAKTPSAGTTGPAPGSSKAP